MPRVDVILRAYGSLNDFVPTAHRQMAWTRNLDIGTSVKDAIEGCGVPHPEVDLVLVNGESVGFDYRVSAGDRIAAYPRFVQLDVAGISRVRPSPPGPARFVVDVHLGTLARRLRLAGLDTLYSTAADDAMLAELALGEQRILLTRDRTLLMRRKVTHGYFVRETRPHAQFIEVLRRFGPVDLQPFSRCLRCNGLLQTVSRTDVDAVLPPGTRAHHDDFKRCSACARVYWRGSHWPRLTRLLQSALDQSGPG